MLQVRCGGGSARRPSPSLPSRGPQVARVLARTDAGEEKEENKQWKGRISENEKPKPD